MYHAHDHCEIRSRGYDLLSHIHRGSWDISRHDLLVLLGNFHLMVATKNGKKRILVLEVHLFSGQPSLNRPGVSYVCLKVLDQRDTLELPVAARPVLQKSW